MPTIALNNSVSYAVLNKYSFDVQKTFTPISCMGNSSFIFAMWITDLFDGLKSNTNQFVFAAIAMIITGLLFYSYLMCLLRNRNSNQT
jgi:NHS family xanthosine MFS transporter